MSVRNLKRRMDALDYGRESEEVIAGLAVIRETGSAPPGPAGVRARELWQEAVGRGLMDDPLVIWMSCYLTATRQSLAEVMASLPADDPPRRTDFPESSWKDPDE